MEWVQGIQNAINYIENNIADELDYNDIAKNANVSSFHFQRAFSILCGISLGEYIRNRRLTLAGMELSSGSAKIIDVAMKYGYDSPDSFTKAFTRFHEITPSNAKKEGSKLKSVASLKIKIILEGGNIMDYKIETKPAFTVVGTVREFNDTTSYKEIPQFWGEHFGSGDGQFVNGQFGICFDHNTNSKLFNYMIADSIEGKE
ncbi:MAG: AraC family transcriptional regulator, partial [Oscillospiraceae bacterium]|nr:AraC family transcriptional regulator [Oscillospiraceae bacterium]